MAVAELLDRGRDNNSDRKISHPQCPKVSTSQTITSLSIQLSKQFDAFYRNSPQQAGGMLGLWGGLHYTSEYLLRERGVFPCEVGTECKLTGRREQRLIRR